MIARRKFLHLTAGAAMAPALPRIASALDYPTRPVRVVVGFAAGGTPDITARLIAEALTNRIGQFFFVEDKPGAGTNLGTEAVATAAPDGYTLLHVTTVNVLSAVIHEKLNFDFARDIVPVVNLVHGAFVMVVNPEFPAGTVAEFIAYAKANPGKINMASTGSGNLTHVSGELFKMMAGVDLVHVPYGTEGAAQTDLMSGRAHVMFDPLLSSIAQIKAGKLKALGVTTLKRADILPDTPPISDTVAGYEVTGWQGMGAPPNTQHAHRHHRQAQHHGERGIRRRKIAGAACRSRARYRRRHAGRFRQAHRRGNRKVGQGRSRRQYQGRLGGLVRTGKGNSMKRRSFLHLAAGAVATPVVWRAARAETYPSRPVHLIIGYLPGGSADMTARLFGQWLSDRLGQQVIVESRAGASTNIATEAVVRAAPDGYTLLLVSPANATNAALYDKLNFDFLRDIDPVAGLIRFPDVVDFNLALPVKTIPELIAYAKANPGALNFGSSGVGSTLHVAGELFKMMAGVNIVHVPYRGGAPAMIDLIGGRVQVMFDNVPTSVEFIRSVKIRPLAVTSSARIELFPDLPTVADYVPGYEASAWYGIGAPKGTPAEIVEKLNREVNAILADPVTKARLAELGASLLPGSPADFGKLVADETEKWGKVIRFAGIKAE